METLPYKNRSFGFNDTVVLRLPTSSATSTYYYCIFWQIYYCTTSPVSFQEQVLVLFLLLMRSTAKLCVWGMVHGAGGMVTKGVQYEA